MFIFLASIAIIIALSSCAVLKKDKTTTTKQTEKTEIVTDTISKETISKKINDSATFKIPEVSTGDAEYDRRVNEGVINALRGFNFQKTSGDNSYRFYYDEQLKALRAEIQVGETRNKEIATNKEASSEKTFEQSVKEYIKKIVIPWWIYAIAIFMLRKQIFGILAFIYPPIRGLKTLRDIVTPPNQGNQSPHRP